MFFCGFSWTSHVGEIQWCVSWHCCTWVTQLCVCVCVNSLGSAGPVKQPGWVTTSEVKKFSVVFVIFKCYHITKFIIRIAIQSKFVKIITKTLGDLMKAIRQVSNAFVKSEKTKWYPTIAIMTMPRSVRVCDFLCMCVCLWV